MDSFPAGAATSTACRWMSSRCFERPLHAAGAGHRCSASLSG